MGIDLSKASDAEIQAELKRRRNANISGYLYLVEYDGVRSLQWNMSGCTGNTRILDQVKVVVDGDNKIKFESSLSILTTFDLSTTTSAVTPKTYTADKPEALITLSPADAKVVYEAAAKEPTEQLTADYAKFKHLLK